MTTSPRDPDTHARHPHLPAEETGALVDATIAALTQRIVRPGADHDR